MARHRDERRRHMTEDLWSRVRDHLTTKEWAQVAGTCKASWGVPLKWASLQQDIPPAGWKFILQRSQKAVGFEVSFADIGDIEQAKLLLESISAAPTAFVDVKELRVSGDFRSISMSGLRPQLAPHMAFTSMAIAFRNVEVLVLTRNRLQLLPPFQNVRHLVVSLPDLRCVLEGLHNLPVLETLWLDNSDHNLGCDRGWDLNCKANTHLQHVALRDFVPEYYAFPSNCKVHAHWTRCHSTDDFLVWVQNPLWTDRRLASFNVQPLLTSLDNGTMYAEGIEQVLSLERDLDYVNLAFRRIGSARTPFCVGKKTLGLVQAKIVNLEGHHGCHVEVDREAALAWTHFSIHTSEEASLDFGGYPNMKFIEGLQDFAITCRAISGPGSHMLSHALASVGRQVHVAGSPTCWWLDTFENNTSENVAAHQRFHTLMRCGCNACLRCLKAAGKLPPDCYRPREVLRDSDPYYV